jgi:hypothetical protein
VPVGIFPKLPEERSSLLLRRGTFTLNYLEKGKERLRIGGKEFLGSTHEGLLVTTAVQVDPARRQYWNIGNKG